MSKIGDLKINIVLENCLESKEQLNDIEGQLDRIISKQKQIINIPKRIITCQNCQAILADFDDKGSVHIHLSKEDIYIEDKYNPMTLKCRCGCITQYKNSKS